MRTSALRRSEKFAWPGRAIFPTGPNMTRTGDALSLRSRLNGACKAEAANRRRRTDREEKDGHQRLRGRELARRSQKKAMKTIAKLRENDTGGRAKVKRIAMLLSVVALMVVMLAMSVAPAFAKSTYTCQSQYGTHSGVSKEAVKNSTFYFNCVKERNNV